MEKRIESGDQSHLGRSSSSYIPPREDSDPGCQEWVVAVQKKIEKRTVHDRCDRVCIYKVAPRIRRAKPEAFTPVLIYLGPYHSKHLEDESSFGDEWKFRVARLVKDEVFASFIREIESKEDELRSYYRGQLQTQSPQCLCFSLALDALFIASLALNAYLYWLHDGEPTDLESFLQPAFLGVIDSDRADADRDILLLENQIPLVLVRYAIGSLLSSSELIIEEEPYKQIISHFGFHLAFMSPFDCHFAHPSPHLETQSHLLQFLYNLCTCGNVRSKEEISRETWAGAMIVQKICSICWSIGENVCQITRVWATIRGEKNDSPASTKRFQISTASYLRRAGIRFKGVSTNCTGIYFDKRSATLQLPMILIQKDTECVVRNLMAYEQHMDDEPGAGTSSVFVPYVQFMDYLIDTPNDVDELVRNGILVNLKGSSEKVVRMWDNICDGTTSVVFSNPDNPFHVVARDLHEYCEVRRHKWAAAFKETYLEKSPWLLVSIVVGAILLVLTFLQTYYTIIAYHR